MKKIAIIILAVLGVSYFFSLTLLQNKAQVHNSPDEHAAFYLAKSMADSGLPRIESSAPDEVKPIVHPRSIKVSGDYIVPGSFLGFPVFAGASAFVFGDWSIYFFSIFIFGFSVFAWFCLMRQFNSPYVAEIATFLYVIHPAIWYYLARTTMHNVTFYALIIIGYWLLIERPLKKSIINSILAGLIFGAAFEFRLFESIPIIILSLFAIPQLFPKERRLSEIAAFILSGFVITLPFLFFNNALFGHWLGSGYADSGSVSTFGEAPATLESTGTAKASESWLLPFGFHERVILKNVWDYGFKLFPWLSLLSFVGVFAFLKSHGISSIKKYLPLLVFITWLFIVYGSWKITDNPDPSAITIANSYIRYWIPWSLVTIVLSALGISYLAKESGRLKIPFIILFLTISTLLSTQSVLLGEDGLLATKSRLLEYAADKDLIIKSTEENSIIITDTADKYLFPDRQVVARLRSEGTLAALDELAAAAPLYYFGITFPESDLEFFKETQLNNRGLEISEVMSIREQTLYKIELNEK